jgi:hypothetical protein
VNLIDNLFLKKMRILGFIVDIINIKAVRVTINHYLFLYGVSDDFFHIFDYIIDIILIKK